MSTLVRSSHLIQIGGKSSFMDMGDGYYQGEKDYQLQAQKPHIQNNTSDKQQNNLDGVEAKAFEQKIGLKLEYGLQNGSQNMQSVNQYLLRDRKNTQIASQVTDAQSQQNLSQRLTIVFDLDDTLIHSSTPSQAPQLPSEVQNYVVAQGSELNPNGIHITERPGLQHFLSECQKLGDLVLFTAAVTGYAEYVIRQGVDPKGSLFKKILYRQSTTQTKYFKYVKDLSLLQTDLARTVIIDDTPQAYLKQPCNGIPVVPFRTNPDDRVLVEQVLPILKALSNCSDVRVYLDQRFHIRDYFLDLGYIDSELEDQSYEQRGYNQASKSRSQLLQMQHKIAQQMKLHLQLQFDVNNVNLGTEFKQQKNSFQLTSRSKKQQVSNNDMVNLKELGYDYILVCDFDHTLMETSILEQLLRVFRCQQQLAELQLQSQYVQNKQDTVELYNQYLGYLCKVVGLSRQNVDKVMMYIGQKQIPNAVKEMFMNAKKLRMLPIVITEGVGYLVEKTLEGAKLKPFVSSVIGNQLQSNQDTFRVQGLLSNYNHDCPYCAKSFCKGTILSYIKQSYKNMDVIYVCDGTDDLCPLLRLESNDSVLIRQNYSLEQFLRFKGRRTLKVFENLAKTQSEEASQGDQAKSKNSTQPDGSHNEGKIDQLFNVISSKIKRVQFWSSYQALLTSVQHITDQSSIKLDNSIEHEMQVNYSQANCVQGQSTGNQNFQSKVNPFGVVQQT